jgi:hypothetical protein
MTSHQRRLVRRIAAIAVAIALMIFVFWSPVSPRVALVQGFLIAWVGIISFFSCIGFLLIAVLRGVQFAHEKLIDAPAPIKDPPTYGFPVILNPPTDASANDTSSHNLKAEPDGLSVTSVKKL